MTERMSQSLGRARRIMQLPRTLVIGHRGARAVAPENTLPSFAAALAAGADLVEFDYRHSSDGVPVVIHDANLARTTDAKRKWRGSALDVSARSLAEMRTLDAGAWMGTDFARAPMPTLIEAVDAIMPGAVPLIERKDGDAATCARLLQEYSLVDEVIVIAFDWKFLRDLRLLLPGLQLGALGPSPATRRIAKGIDRNRLGAPMLDQIRDLQIDLVVWNSRVNQASVAAAHARGMRVWIYTVNDPVVAVKLVSAGVDGIISDDPAGIRRALESRR
jgi:glycerophosphoryl diester phosphodiesterase